MAVPPLTLDIFWEELSNKPMYKAKDLAKFVKTQLLPLLPDEYTAVHGNRTVLRMRGHFVQWIGIGTSRSGWIDIFPTLYVVGAHNTEIVMTGTARLYDPRDPRKWTFPKDISLDQSFARLIIERIETETPISFIQPLDDETIIKALVWFNKQVKHWAVKWYIAFWYLCQGDPSALPYLNKLEKYFAEVCGPKAKYPVRDWEKAHWARIKLLQARMSDSHCVVLCREEAEQHAAQLGLPKLVWPTEWATEMRPAKQQSLLANIFGL